MLKINIHEPKQLTFEVQIAGVSEKQIDSYVRINIDDIEYGFKTKVEGDTVTVNIPPLDRIIGNHNIREDKEYDMKLEMIADGYHIVPWSEKV